MFELPTLITDMSILDQDDDYGDVGIWASPIPQEPEERSLWPDTPSRPSLGGIVHPRDIDIARDYHGFKIVQDQNTGTRETLTINDYHRPITSHYTSARKDAFPSEYYMVSNLSGQPVTEAFINFPEPPSQPSLSPTQTASMLEEGLIFPEDIQQHKATNAEGFWNTIVEGRKLPPLQPSSRSMAEQASEPSTCLSLLQIESAQSKALDLPVVTPSGATSEPPASNQLIPKELAPPSLLQHSVADSSSSPSPSPPRILAPTQLSLVASSSNIANQKQVQPEIIACKARQAQTQSTPRDTSGYPVPSSTIPPVPQSEHPPRHSPLASTPQQPIPTPDTPKPRSPSKETRVQLAPIRTQHASRTKRHIQESPRKEAFYAAATIIRQESASKGKQRSLSELDEPAQTPEREGSYNTEPIVPQASASTSRSSSETKDGPAKKRYPCPVEGCDKSFTRRNDVQRHLKSSSAHRNFNEIPADSLTRCQYCNRVLSRNDSARRHETEGACGKRTLKSEREAREPVQKDQPNDEPVEEVQRKNS